MHAGQSRSNQPVIYLLRNRPRRGIASPPALFEVCQFRSLLCDGCRRPTRVPVDRPFNARQVVAHARLMKCAPLPEVAGQLLETIIVSAWHIGIYAFFAS